MLVRKDLLNKHLVYSYFALLPVIAAMEAISAGSNKIYNGIFLVLFMFATFNLYRRSFADRYILLFFLFAISILVTNSLLYGLDLSSEYIPNMSEGLKISFRALMLAFITYFAFLLTRFGVLRAKDLTVIAVFLVVSMAFGQLFGASDSSVEGVGNEYALQGLTGHVAITSSILLSTIPILLINSLKSRLSLFALLLCIAAIVFTFRRSAWLILSALLVIHLYLIYFKSSMDPYKQLKILLLLLAGTASIGLFLTLNQDVYQAIVARLEDLNVSQGGTGAGRSIFWGILWDYTLNQPIINFLLGNGYGFIHELLYGKFGSAIGAHNDWLEILLSFGIFPLILFALMNLSLILRTMQKGFHYKLLLAYSIFSLLALSITTGGVFDTYFAFLHVTIGFVLASQQNRLEDKSG